MLYGFVCENYSSYNEECILTMEATKIKDYDDINTITTDYGKILKNILIYGANGSGKSNLLKGIQYMRNLVTGSVVNPKILSMNESFKFNNKSKELPTKFEASFIIEGIMYTYGFSIYENTISKEWLYKKQKRETILFNRLSPEYKDIKLHGEFKDAENVKRHTREDALFLTTAGMLNISIANKIINWFSQINILTDYKLPHGTVEYIEENPEIKNLILNCLKKADIGIDGLNYSIKDIDIDDSKKEELLNNFMNNVNIDNINILDVSAQKLEIYTTHSIYNENKTVDGTINLPFEKYQSEGTKKLFSLIGPIIKSLNNGEVVIIDEIDSKLHPSIVRFIISMFNSIDNNKNNSQLICNTHDVMLLQENIRRDQIWFVEKNKYGESKLYSLSDFTGVRKTDSILKKYLLGVFGAIPFKNERGLF